MRTAWETRLVAAGAVALCSLALTACDDDGGEDGRRGKSEPSALNPGRFNPVPVVDDPGTGDLRALTLDLEAGDRATTTFDIDITASSDAFTVTVPLTIEVDEEVLDVGPVISTVRTTIADVSVDGTGLDPHAAHYIEAGLAAAEGLDFTTDLAPTGDTMRSLYPTDDHAALEAIGSLGQMPGFPLNQASVIFPTEPIGVGAVWHRMIVVQSDYETTSYGLVTYTLEALTGDRYRMSYRITDYDKTDATEVQPGSGELEGTLHTFWPISLIGDGREESDTDVTETHFQATTS